MANLATLKAALNAAIYQNNQNAITGEALNTILNSIIDTLGAGYRYAGVATPSANPGTIDNRVFYFATAAGTYTNFGAAQLDGKSLHVFIYDTTWHNIALDVPTNDALPQAHNVDWSYLIGTFPSQSIEKMQFKLLSKGTAGGITRNDVYIAQFLGLNSQATAAEVRAVVVDIITNKKALKAVGNSGVQMNTSPVAADNINPFVLQQNLMAVLSTSTITADECAISARYELVNGWQLILFASSSDESPYAGLFLQPRKNIFIAPDANLLKDFFVADYTADAGHALGGLNSNIQIRSAFLQGIFEYIYEDDADCGNLHKIIDTDYPIFNGDGIVRIAAYGGICRYEHLSNNTFYLGPDNFILYTDDDLEFKFDSARPLLPPQLYSENEKKVYGINPILAHPEVYQQLMSIALNYLEREQGLSNVFINSILAVYGNIEIGDDLVINALFAYILMWYNENGTDKYGLFVYEI